MTTIEVIDGISYNYEKFYNKGISVYPHSHRLKTSCIGVFSSNDTVKFINGVSQNALLRLEYEHDLLQREHDVLKSEVADLKCLLAEKGVISSVSVPASNETIATQTPSDAAETTTLEPQKEA
jgi:hypothetical protein